MNLLHISAVSISIATSNIEIVFKEQYIMQPFPANDLHSALSLIDGSVNQVG